jgi:hypothetical protein
MPQVLQPKGWRTYATNRLLLKMADFEAIIRGGI